MRPSRRLSLAGLLTALALLVPSLASADTSSSLTVVGTSDVSDSGLMPNLIQPQFSQQFPQFTFKYNGSATGAAIQAAENGTGGPSVLIVHAASLENQFVAGGYSYPTGAYGNAIFTNDFVLAGATGDPAGVAGNASHDIAQAFADVAAAGATGKATFITRGGTNTAPGTTVEEHALWALVNSSGLKPPSLSLCTVSTADGGGMSPIKPGTTLDAAGDCPDSGTVNSTDAPSWYIVNSGANQGANVIAANACNGYANGPASCYVLTDRGTYDYLSSGTDPAGAIPGLSIVTRDNAAAAPGGADALINYFHAYIINPAKPGETVNVDAAQDFVNFLTSPAFQAELGSYLPTADPGGAPFKADASPSITAAATPAGAISPGSPVTITGQATNNEPGYAPIASQPVILDQVVAGTELPVAKSVTGPTGAYSISFTPSASGVYQVTTGTVSLFQTQLNLTPAYGDVLVAGASPAFTMTVEGAARLTAAYATSGGAAVAGTLSPAAGATGATVVIQARRAGSSGAYRTVGTAALAVKQTAFAANARLGAGTWQLVASYQAPGQFTTETSLPRTVTVGLGSRNRHEPHRSTTKPTVVSLRSAQARGTALAVSGMLSRKAPARGAIKLLVLSTTGPGFTQIATKQVKAGAKRFSVTRSVAQGTYIVELEYVTRGQTPVYSKVSGTVTIG